MMPSIRENLVKRLSVRITVPAVHEPQCGADGSPIRSERQPPDGVRESEESAGTVHPNSTLTQPPSIGVGSGDGQLGENPHVYSLARERQGELRHVVLHATGLLEAPDDDEDAAWRVGGLRPWLRAARRR